MSTKIPGWIVSLVDSLTGFSATVTGAGAVKVDGSAVDQPIIQDAWALPHNSSVANINAGATWSGSQFDSTLGVAAIQVNIVASQNCTVYVDQSMSGINTDITDEFKYIASKGGNSWTVQATASYVKVRVKNTSPAQATGVEIQTVLCPIVEAVPRALGAYGNLKVSVRDILSPGFEKRNIISPMRALKVAESFKLVGASFYETLDANFWTASLGTGGTATATGGELLVSTGTNSNNVTSVKSVRSGRYVAASPNYFRAVIVLPTVTTASAGHVNTRRWGAYDLGTTPAGNGYFFEAVQTNPEAAPTLKLYSRKNGTDSAAITSFNGDLGSTYVLDTNVHTYEIYWTNSSAWFFIDDEFLHKISASTATVSGTNTLFVTLLSANSGANTSANVLTCRAASINRLGKPECEVIYKNLLTAATTVLKIGAGRLHKVFTNDGAAGSSLAIYDNTAGAGTLIATINTSSLSVPTVLEFGVAFFTGLTVVMTGDVNCTFIYE
jgi:hypothetical protein